MSTIINSKISLRRDDLSNWLSADPILNEGELAIVVLSGGIENIKFGNGISSFSQLPYMYQSQFQSEQIKTTELRARSISQGYNTQSVPTSIATGIFTESFGNFGVTHGIEARVKEGDDYAFVWNGINGTTNDRYQSHGEGTFSINPVNGLSGFFIGERSVDKTFVGENGLSVDYTLSSCILKLHTANQTISTMVPRFANTTIMEWDDEFGTLVYRYDGKINELSIIGDLQKSNLSDSSQVAVKIEVGKQILSIGIDCFTECQYIREIDIPLNVVQVGNNSFGGLLELSCIKFYESTTEQIRSVLPQDFKDVGISSDIVYNKYGELVSCLV